VLRCGRLNTAPLGRRLLLLLLLLMPASFINRLASLHAPRFSYSTGEARRPPLLLLTITVRIASCRDADREVLADVVEANKLSFKVSAPTELLASD